MDEDIRALAKLHGHEDISDADVKYVRQKIAAAFIDGLLDAETKSE